MTALRPGRRHAHPRMARGFSLLETLFALVILLIVALGIIPLGFIATTTTENQGHLMARVMEYAQDKMEQLLSLSYADTTSDTRVFPASDTGGSGLKVGGSSNVSAPVTPYVDFLDVNGNVLTTTGTAEPANWFYKRVWAIEAVGTAGTLKRVTVTAATRTAVGFVGAVPSATVTSLKSYPF